jgi:large subunit ribosomal protein L21
MTFAIIEDGSRQYHVEAGNLLTIDYRKDLKEGDELSFAKVLLANGGGTSLLGRPTIDGATVSAVVINDLFKGVKLEIQKHRRRHNSKRHTGHRQKHTVVKITGITVPNLDVVTAPEPAAAT